MDATLLGPRLAARRGRRGPLGGRRSPAAFQPIDSVPAVHLPAMVADLVSGLREEQWALLEGADGRRGAAGRHRPLSAAAGRLSAVRPAHRHHAALHATATRRPAHRRARWRRCATSRSGWPPGCASSTARAVLAAHISAERPAGSSTSTPTRPATAASHAQGADRRAGGRADARLDVTDRPRLERGRGLPQLTTRACARPGALS